jgi:RNA polymerase primary sigma factor
MEYKPLSPDELSRTNAEIMTGSLAARHKIILAYRPLIYKISSRLARQYTVPSECIDEVFAYSMHYLFEIINKYEPQRAGFPTFLRWYLPHAVRGYVGTFHFVCVISAQTVRDIRQVAATVDAVIISGEYPTHALVAQQSGLSSDKIARFFKPEQRPGVAESLSSPVTQKGGETNLTLVDVLASNDVSALDMLQSKQAVEKISEAIQMLTKREQYVIKARMGIDGPELTLEEVGCELKVSKERARQIQVEAVEKLQKYFSRRRLSYQDLAAE